jgi:hypothetical protein
LVLVLMRATASAPSASHSWALPIPRSWCRWGQGTGRRPPPRQSTAPQSPITVVTGTATRSLVSAAFRTTWHRQWSLWLWYCWHPGCLHRWAAARTHTQHLGLAVEGLSTEHSTHKWSNWTGFSVFHSIEYIYI